MRPWRRVGDGEWVGTDASERFPIYTRGNAGEVYPEVYRPLSFSIAQQAGEQAMRNAILSSGIIRPDELDAIPLSTGIGSGVFGGYAYLNLSVQRLVAARVPGGSWSDADNSFLGAGDPPPHVPLAIEKNRRAGVAGLRYLWRQSGVTELPQLALDQRIVDEFLAGLPDPSTAADHDLRNSMLGVTELFMPMFETHLKVSFAASALMAVLTQLCEKQLGNAELAVRLVSGLGDVDSAAPSIALWLLGRKVAASDSLTAEFDVGVAGVWDRLQVSTEAAEFNEKFRQFIADFGSRGPNEWDTAFDTWETDPELALAFVDRMRLTDESHAPTTQGDRLALERRTLETDVMSRLRWPTKRLFSRVLVATRLHMQSRERTKTTVVRAIHGARLQGQELDRRLAARSGGERGDLWFLVEEELDGYVDDPASCAPQIAERRELLTELQRRIPPFYFEGEQPPVDTWELRSTQVPQVVVGEVLTGLAGCAGVATGRARVVTNPGDPRGLEPGDVLIAPLTDPSWTPLFVPAEAVIVDVGAVMSHAIIVSRELGIPCAVSVTDATRRIPDGALVEVDGGAGTVRILELP
jgi:phosphohistidine swiveling domain-containing protein